MARQSEREEFVARGYQNLRREGTRPSWLFGYVTVQEREPERVFFRVKAKKSLQRRDYVRGRRLAPHSGRHAGFSAVRNTKLGRASCHRGDYARFSDSSRLCVGV